ncbi:phosphatase, putative, partial [Hepatocystis sp. ex Piliocolobus tephrosceles]
ITYSSFVKYHNFVLSNNNIYNVVRRILSENNSNSKDSSNNEKIKNTDGKDRDRNKKNEGKEKEEEEEDDEDYGGENVDYMSYIKDRGTDEFDKVKYNYMDYVKFTIVKSANTYRHIYNEFLVFIGSQYETDEEIVLHLKLNDILSLLFVHYKDNLSEFDHIINSFQDRKKLTNALEKEFFREFLDERDNYIYNINTYFNKSKDADEEKEEILRKKKQLYNIFLRNWRNDGYRFYSIYNRKKAYIPKKIDLQIFKKKGILSIEELEQQRQHNNKYKERNMVSLPFKGDDNTSITIQKSEIDDRMTLPEELYILEKQDEKDNEQNEYETIDINGKRNKKSNKNISELNISSVIKNGMNKSYNVNNRFDKDRQKSGNYSENDSNDNSNKKSVYYQMRDDFFLSDKALNVMTILNAISSNKDNKVVTKLYEFLKMLNITTFEHLIRYTNILGIFFAYDIFDELYLQIKLIKEYFGFFKNENRNYQSLIEESEKKKKIIIYKEYKMKEDEMFVPYNCLNVYCKLRSAWVKNKTFDIKINRHSIKSINFMTIGDIGQGLEDEKNNLQNIYAMFGFNELKKTVDAMKHWHYQNNADFIINLGDNIPNDDSVFSTEHMHWYKFMKELFVFKKRSEEEIADMFDNKEITDEKINEFYQDQLDKARSSGGGGSSSSSSSSTGDGNNNMNSFNSTSNVNNLNQQTDEGGNKKQRDNTTNKYDSGGNNINTDMYEEDSAIPFYSIYGEKDYFYFPSEQIHEHYSNRIPGYFMPNNYYCINYDFTFTDVNGKENNEKDNFRASFIFIDTWALLVGFPIIRNYRSYREQYNWISQTLYESAKNSDWIFLVGHHSLLSSGIRSGDYTFEENSFYDVLRDFLFTYNVDAYFSANDHLLEYIKFGNANLFVNGSAARVLFDNSYLGRGYFGKVIGKMYPITCYILKTIHVGLKPKGCTLNRYSKWANKEDIGFSVHKLTKNEMVTEFINSRTGKPISHKIVIKNKRAERLKYYNLDKFVDIRMNELENKINEFQFKNPEFVNYKIKQIEEYNYNLEVAMSSLTTSKERDAFETLIHFNNVIFDISSNLEPLGLKKLKLMHKLANKFKGFFHKDYTAYIETAIEKIKQKESSSINNQISDTNNNNSDDYTNDGSDKKQNTSIISMMDDHVDMDDSEEYMVAKQKLKNTIDNALAFVQSLNLEATHFLKQYDELTDSEKKLLPNKLQLEEEILNDYVRVLRNYVFRQKAEQFEKDRRAELDKKQKEAKNAKKAEDIKDQEEKNVTQKEEDTKNSKQTKNTENKNVDNNTKTNKQNSTDDEDKEVVTKAEVREAEGEDEIRQGGKDGADGKDYGSDKNNKSESVQFKNNVNKFYYNFYRREIGLNENDYTLLMLSALKSYDKQKYFFNMDTKKDLMKHLVTSNYIKNIEEYKIFFHLPIDLSKEIKRILSNLGGVGLRLPYFKLIMKIHNEIVKLKNEIDKIAVE